MARYRLGLEQVTVYLTIKDIERLKTRWMPTRDRSLSAYASRLLLERLAQVEAASPVRGPRMEPAHIEATEKTVL